MTVVAFDGKIMACDSQISYLDGNEWGGCKKIKKINGWLIGAAGNWSMLTHFLAKFDPKAIEQNKSYSPINPAPGKGDFEALAISLKGEVYYIEDNGVFGKINTRGFIAIGSGTTAAMSAMAAGANAVRAVKIACKYDKNCGGRSYILKL